MPAKPLALKDRMRALQVEAAEHSKPLFEEALTLLDSPEATKLYDRLKEITADLVSFGDNNGALAVENVINSMAGSKLAIKFALEGADVLINQARDEVNGPK